MYMVASETRHFAQVNRFEALRCSFFPGYVWKNIVLFYNSKLFDFHMV